MASRESSASEGEVIEHQQKANSISQHRGRKINGSGRVFGLDGTSDNYDYNRRALSRSPSPYRGKRTRSPSPYRHRARAASRSPSPFHHGRTKREQRPPRSRDASPRRPEKRHRTDHGRYSEPYPASRPGMPRFQHGDYSDSRKNVEVRLSPRPGPTSPGDRPKLVSYADRDEKPPPIPDFTRSAIILDSSAQERTKSIPIIMQDKAKVNGAAEHGKDSRPLKDASRNPPRNDQPSSNKRVAATAAPSVVENLQETTPWMEPEYSLDPVTKAEELPQESREEKRRRWAAIRAAAEKDKAKDSLLQQALLANASENTTPTVASPAVRAESSVSPSASPRMGDLDYIPGSPDVMVVDKQGGVNEGNSPVTEGTSAADYDPTKDMLDDRDRAARKARQSELPSDAYSETNPKLLSTLPAEKAFPVKKQKKDFDMFNFEDDDDDDDDGNEEEVVEQTVEGVAKGTVLDEKLLDNWDDPEGYYKIISNELVNAGRYRMIKSLGRGVFANVAQAEDLKMQGDEKVHKLVAIKMIRRNDLMRKASQKEMEVLRKVNDADPHDKRHIIRLLGSFDHKGHLCAVFEHMSKNLRDLLKEDTNGHGLSLQAVRTYARQLFVGLQHLQNCQVVHCDLKPDNILVSPDKKTVKICDFGTAVDKRDIMERTEYLVSRFYRAPEIILGMEIGYGIDMWAIGCTLYELWTGKILFTGRTNNQMVKAFMDCLGWPTEKLLKKGLLANVLEHFEAGPPLKFISREVDQHGNVSIRKIEQQKKIPRDLKSRISDAARGIAQGGPTATELNDFADLLGACLNLNVEKRMQPKEALAHRFFPQPKPAPRPAVIKPALMKRPGRR